MCVCVCLCVYLVIFRALSLANLLAQCLFQAQMRFESAVSDVVGPLPQHLLCFLFLLPLLLLLMLVPTPCTISPFLPLHLSVFHLSSYSLCRLSCSPLNPTFYMYPHLHPPSYCSPPLNPNYPPVDQPPHSLLTHSTSHAPTHPHSLLTSPPHIHTPSLASHLSPSHSHTMTRSSPLPLILTHTP